VLLIAALLVPTVLSIKFSSVSSIPVRYLFTLGCSALNVKVGGICLRVRRLGHEAEQSNRV
jgi:hypothetical protein